ncbi:hypothetical protein ACFWJN_31975, partial [Streptomyces albidochromogenes]
PAPSGLPAPRTSDSPAPATPVGKARWASGEPGARPAVRTPAADGTPAAQAARTGTRPGSAPRDDAGKPHEKAKGKSKDRPGKGKHR